MQKIILYLLLGFCYTSSAQDISDIFILGEALPKNTMLEGYTEKKPPSCNCIRYTKEEVNLSVSEDSSSINQQTIIVFYDSSSTVYGVMQKVICNNSDESLLRYSSLYQKFKSTDIYLDPSGEKTIRDGKDNGFDGVYYYKYKDKNNEMRSVGIIDNIFYREKYIAGSPYLARLVN